MVITGAGGTIGRAVSHAFGEAGALLVLVDQHKEGLERTRDGLAANSSRQVTVNLCDHSLHSRIFETARELGQLVSLVNIAGVIVRKPDVDGVSDEDWDRQHDANLKATFFLCRSAYHLFLDQASTGSIVNFASQSWLTGGVGGSVAYAASKGGVVSLTRGLARSFAPAGVRVNAVSPGGVESTMMRSGMGPAAVDDFVSKIPLGRLCSPEEIAGAVLYLASDASSYVTGSLLDVSGGQAMY